MTISKRAQRQAATPRTDNWYEELPAEQRVKRVATARGLLQFASKTAQEQSNYSQLSTIHIPYGIDWRGEALKQTGWHRWPEKPGEGFGEFTSFADTEGKRRHSTGQADPTISTRSGASPIVQPNQPSGVPQTTKKMPTQSIKPVPTIKPVSAVAPLTPATSSTKQSAAALGIPDRSVYGDPLAGQLTPGQLADWVVQEHMANRAGRHFDVRLGTPETGLYSWAVRKGLPPPGERHLAVQQPLHEHDYRTFEGSIPSGYGAGQVRRHDLGQVLITRVEPNTIHFTHASSRFPERYALVKPKEGRNWLMLNTTKTEAIPYQKQHYTSVPANRAEEIIGKLHPNSSLQAKIDGAASLTRLFKDHVEVTSYRQAKETGRPIVHTERIFHGRPASQIPPELVGSVLRGEIYGVGEKGTAIPPQQLGGLLNAAISRSMSEQTKQKIKLKNMLFDIHQLGRQPVAHLPYRERLDKLKSILQHLPQDTFHLPEEAGTAEQARALWERVRSGQHPLTHEGVVIHPPTGKPSKIKLFDEHDVYVRGVFPGEGKYKGTHAGGFNYSHTPTGPVVGEVGTGLTDELRKDLYENPNLYVGRVARVQAQEKHPSGALRSPSLIAMHEDATAPLAAAGALEGLSTARGRQQAKRRLATNPVRHAGRALDVLLQAKAESDRRNYSLKHELLRKLITAEPHNFEIDSREGDIVGLTHRPTNFRIHMPAGTVPEALLQREKQT